MKNNDESQLARLLFCETLLEEYESLDQPPLAQSELKKIRDDIGGLSPHKCADVAKETVFGGEMMKRIYQLINEAQRKAEKTYKAPDEAPESVASGNGDNAIQQGNGTPLVYGKSVLPKPEKLAECGLGSALCLSGGGVRSATFNLGILQGLARHGLLDKFDYLSTVSGGGFIGGWLSAWVRRAGLANVCNESARRRTVRRQMTSTCSQPQNVTSR